MYCIIQPKFDRVCIFVNSFLGFLQGLYNENKDFAVQSLLMHLPLLHPGNNEAKEEYLTLLPNILSHSLDNSIHEEECRQLFSLAVVHPAFTQQDKVKLNFWLSLLAEREDKVKEKQHSLALHHTLSDSSAHFFKGHDSWRMPQSGNSQRGGHTNGWRQQSMPPQQMHQPQQQQEPLQQTRKRLDHKDSGISTSFDELGSGASGRQYIFLKHKSFYGQHNIQKCLRLFKTNL